MAAKAISALDLIVHDDPDIRNLFYYAYDVWHDALFQLDKEGDAPKLVTFWCFRTWEYRCNRYERLDNGTIQVHMRQLGRCGLV